MNVFKMCGPQIRLCLFTFGPSASKQLNSLTTIDSLSCLGVAEVLVGLSLIRPVLSIIRKPWYKHIIFDKGMPPDPPRISPQTQFGRTTFQLPATALYIDIIDTLNGVSMTALCRGNASALGARGSQFQLPAPAGVFMFEFLFCCVFTFCPKTHNLTYFYFCNSFFSVNLFSTLNTHVLQNLWPIIRV